MRRDERGPSPEAGAAASLYPKVDTGRADWGEAQVRQRHVMMSAHCVMSRRLDDILQRFMAEFVAHRMSGTGDFTEKQGGERLGQGELDGSNTIF